MLKIAAFTLENLDLGAIKLLHLCRRLIRGLVVKSAEHSTVPTAVNMKWQVTWTCYGDRGFFQVDMPMILS